MSDRIRTASNLPSIIRTRQLIFAAFPVVVLAALLYAAWQTGPWFDEFWSFYFADPAAGLGEAFRSKWTLDVHPPLFSFLAWLAGQLGLPRTLEAGRMLNLVPLLASTAYLAVFWRSNPGDRAFLATFLPAAVALVQFQATFVEFRSYFTGVCAFIVLLACLKRLDRTGEDPLQGTNRGLVWSGQLASLFFCLNLHFVFALLAIALVGTFALAALARGDRRLFALHLLSGIVCCLLLAATTALQWTYLSSISKNFWLKTTPADALGILVMSVLSPVGQSTAMSLAWLGALGLRIVSKRNNRADDRYAVTLVASLIAIAAIVLAYTVASGALTGRYLIPICLVIVAGTAAATAETLRTYPTMRILFLLACTVAIVQTSLEAAREPKWNEAASFVAEKQKTCPGARIVPIRATLQDATANVEANYTMAYAYLADRWKMTVGALDTMPAPPRDPACPDYFWADNQFAGKRPEPALKAELLRRFPQLDGCAIQTHIFRSEAAIFEVSGDPPQCKR